MRPVGGYGADDRLLQPVDVVAQSESDLFQVENRVYDQLPRAVESDVAASVDAVEFRTPLSQHRLVGEHVGLASALAEGVDGRMFHRQ